MKTIVVLFLFLNICISIYTDEIRIVTAEAPPTNYYMENGEFSGTSTEIVTEIKRILGIDTEIEILPWSRAYRLALYKTDVVAFSCGKTQDRIEHGFHFIGPIITRKHVLWSLKDNNYTLSDIQDIKDQQLVITGLRDDWRVKYFVDRGVDATGTNTHAQALKMLISERIDLWISSDIEAPQVAKKLGVDINQLEIVFVFRELPSFIMLSKDFSDDNLKAWKNAFSEIQKSDFFLKSSGKWSKILGIDLLYKEDRGYYIE